jgi:ABC-type lipoprotein release transport system permease subunit
MKEDLKIAWRNLWRNRRRTLITSSSVFFAVFFAVVMRSIQLGSYDRMIMNFIGSYSGYLQIQHAKYIDDPAIDNSFVCSDTLFSAVLKVRNVVSAAPHIESFVLASSGSQTKGVALLAIDPELEKRFSNPENRLVKYRINDSTTEKIRHIPEIPPEIISKIKELNGSSYSSQPGFELDLGISNSENQKFMKKILEQCSVSNTYLSQTDDGVLISGRLAEYLRVGRGDTVILLGQGYHGASAAGIFPVRGVIKMPSPDIDSRLIIMTISAAGKFFDFNGRITSLAVNLSDKSDRIVGRAAKAIRGLLPDSTTAVKSWKDLNPVMVQQIEGDNQTGIATLFMLYFIIFFGIFGTVLMMIAERTREFGVLIAIGMQRKRLKTIITAEMFMLGLLGLAGGLAASSPVISYFYFHPVILKGDLGKMMEDYGWDAVMPTAWFGPYFYWQAAIVFLMVLVASIYPLRKISRLKEIEALRS